ncbi:MAG TPA: glycoside hydrolase, partial [candidate division WOR-3 bacterium]|nr:glycoside hydrolase [candidate division WOR-3 bacterium]
MSRTKVLFLWHMHQPLYRVPGFRRGERMKRFRLPWVFLHSIREYYDMLRIVEEVPGVRVCFNVVPALLEQIQDYTGGEDIRDDFLEVIEKDPDSLTDRDRSFMLRNFFALNYETQIKPYLRFRELYERRGKPFDLDSKVNRFSARDFLDLQVLFLLANFSEVEKERDDFISGLVAKGRDFSVEEKSQLLRKA